jgi:hypothetical protein
MAFWLGLAGTVGLLLTLYYTRRAVLVAEGANKDANDALAIATRNADSAAAQVEISRDTAQHQLRAYLYPASGEIKLSREVITATCPIRVPFKNTGATPATLLYYRMESSIRSNWAMSKNMSSSKKEKIAKVETSLQKIIGPNNETYLSIDGRVDLKHFDPVSTLAAGYANDGVEFELEIEWHYRDYLNRVWRVEAVFTSDNFKFTSKSASKTMRQKSAQERQIG